MIQTEIKYLSILEQNEILLQNFEKSFEAEKIYSILGKNGCGKTSLLNLLSGSIDNSFFQFESKILFGGENLSSASGKTNRKFRKENIRYVFQDSINSFDLLKKIKYFFNEFSQDLKVIEDLLAYFEMPSFEKIKKQHIYEMSGGMAQRIQLILAFLAKPKYLFLDEPTSALDYPIANLLSKKIKEFVTENASTAIIVTQDLRFALDCSDEIAVLKNKSLHFEENSLDFDSLEKKIY